MEVSAHAFRIVNDLMEARTGHRLAEGRRWRIGTALAPVMRSQRLSDPDQLVARLCDRDQRELADQVIEALLNNETYFFRDTAMFNLLEDRILPDLAAKNRHARRLSIWSAGCSTGQEALSLAMLFRDGGRQWDGWTIDIVGTDISGAAIARAREASYSQFEIQRGLGIERMLAHFTQQGGIWRPDPALRAMVRYSQANILGGPPQRAQYDLILCRNVLLYFDRRRRREALRRITAGLARDGWLMLGSGEDVTPAYDLLQPADRDARLYTRRTSVGSSADRVSQARRLSSVQ
ncbi:MAG: protein-glutamate O-methyltransferase CheR [Pontixanthobacter sp.]